jgi:hypothetical protein
MYLAEQSPNLFGLAATIYYPNPYSVCPKYMPLLITNVTLVGILEWFNSLYGVLIGGFGGPHSTAEST